MLWNYNFGSCFLPPQYIPNVLRLAIFFFIKFYITYKKKKKKAFRTSIVNRDPTNNRKKIKLYLKHQSIAWTYENLVLTNYSNNNHVYYFVCWALKLIALPYQPCLNYFWGLNSYISSLTEYNRLLFFFNIEWTSIYFPIRGFYFDIPCNIKINPSQYNYIDKNIKILAQNNNMRNILAWVHE